MPQSLSQVIVHAVFSTKHHEPWLFPEIRPRIHAYLAAVARDLGCEAFRVGGTGDHVHLALSLARTVTQAELIEKLKTSSSHWLKQQDARLAGFYWQRGYGVFSVGRSGLDDLIRYIDGQEEHHRSRTFQDEYREFLRRYEIEFDERYVWD
jgi:putative transposase